MHVKKATAAAMFALATAASAIAADANRSSNVVSGWLANRLVGAYQSEAQVRECGSDDPYNTVKNTIIFNAGGTVVASPRFPPQGANGYSRTIDLGTWSYNPHTNHYSVSLRFDSFQDGAFTGTSDVERDLQMSADGKTASGSVHVTSYAPDGSVTLETCGTATSTRL